MRIYRVSIRTAATFLFLIGFLALFPLIACRPKTGTLMTAPATAPVAMVDLWKEAAFKVEQDRGEPMGRAAKVEVPAQLRHYSDKRRFLGTQLAESREQHLQTPADFGDLVNLITHGRFVELTPLGKDYILYGVGMLASDEPFTHYDKVSRKSVTLFANNDELQSEYGKINESQKQTNETLTDLRRHLRQAPKRNRELGESLKSDIKKNEQSAAALSERKKLLDSFYGNVRLRGMLFAEYERIATLARNFGNRTYDLSEGEARREFKVRLLSHLRPAALKILEELAQAYREKFARPLPVSSLIRSDEYQRLLRESNPNATLIDVPPHTTGLAFDVFYRFMSAAEQEFVMAELARMRDSGRIEALRELANHFHVFAFADGQPPDEMAIQKSLDQVAPPPVEKKESRRQVAPGRKRRRGR